jgi:hypothetical protein
MIKVGDLVRCLRTGISGRVFVVKEVLDQAGNRLPNMILIDDGKGNGTGFVRDENSLEKVKMQ